MTPQHKHTGTHALTPPLHEKKKLRYPVSSGIKCLALKAWLQPPEEAQM